MTPTKPGSYWHYEPFGEPPQLVWVVRLNGELLALFKPLPGDSQIAAVALADMVGTFAPVAQLAMQGGTG